MEKVGRKPQKEVKVRKVEKFSTDKLALGVYQALLRDFRSASGEGLLMCHGNGTLEPSQIREIKQPSPFGLSPYLFKVHAQMECLLKKYIFEHDSFTDSQREQKTIEKYLEFQRNLRHESCEGVYSSYVDLVLKAARKLAKRILGDFSPEEIVLNARFGSKSSIGCPLHLAYIDHKLTDIGAFTSSSDVARWWEADVIQQDPMMRLIFSSLQAGLAEGCHLHLNIESLILKTVPKKYDIDRTITPLALLNLFYSHGYAALVTERLRVTGLDISRLQEIHQNLVRKYSIDLTHATADATMASESCTTWLLNRVLPRPWFVALKKVMTHQIVLPSGVCSYTESVLPMGNGATFPLETLVFFCLLKAIGQLAGVDGTFSVYGDDMIYPSPLHPYVVRIFPKLGITLNLEKTYVDVEFRESCGSDYYRGVDVRPFYLKGEFRRLTRTKFAVEIYKILNGLLARWDENDIPVTITFLLLELSRLGLQIFRVPASYPEGSGLRTSRPTDIPLGLIFLPWSPVRTGFVTLPSDPWFVSCGTLVAGSINHEFSHLAERGPKRVLQLTSKAESPWYWLWLSNAEMQERRIHTVGLLSGKLNYMLRKLHLATDTSKYTDAPELREWGWFERITSFWKAGKREKKVRRVRRPFCTERGRVSTRVDAATVTDWA